MKLVEVIADAGAEDTINAIAASNDAVDIRSGIVDESGLQSFRLLIPANHVQSTLDSLQKILGAQERARILVIPVEATLPRPSPEERREEKDSVALRESLHETIEHNARVNASYVGLVLLSTVVAATGLINDNTAVVIGAMVIAPLLGPNLGLAFGTAVGDIALMRGALFSTAVGISLIVALCALLGFAWQVPLDSPALLERSRAGMDSIVLALASGAAAALSITTSLPSVLVGVMVAVALLPPAATLGLMLGNGQPALAYGAALLLAVNVVCLNLAAKLVFAWKGLGPRTYSEKERAARAMRVYILTWVVTLALLLALIYP